LTALRLCATCATRTGATRASATRAAAAASELSLRKAIVIETLITDGVAIRAEHRKRLLEDERRRLALSDRGIQNVEAILMKIDGDI
jgi:hypothetical protein